MCSTMRGKSILFAWLAGAACVLNAILPWSTATQNSEIGSRAHAAAGQGNGAKDGPQKRAEALGIKFEKLKPGYLNWCSRSGKMLYTSGFSSKIKGQLGKNITVKEGQAAARECAIDVLRAVWDRHGTLDGLRVVKVLGCVNATADFTDHPKVINGCSDLLHEIFGKETDGHHARSALGFSSLPFGAAVEVEAIFEVKD
jgi:enamine deaminase RidA (YjgF/YER057c/UK114 family)